MNHEQISTRNLQIVEDAKTMTRPEIATKHALNHSYVSRLLVMFGVRAQTKRARLMARIKELAPTSSYSDLEKAFPEISPAYLRALVSVQGIRIGLRGNMRRANKGYSHRQLDILADIKNNPDDSLQTIAMRHGVVREKVGQIRAHAQSLGLLPIFATQEQADHSQLENAS